uniref:Uncharacterized protein n=1 Tax=Anguilla anguilla TaxID=7936 RepID=A0A0E9TXU3_ANGAN
MFLFRIHIISP